jgi:uncharacterized membrane protein (DUF4010 family)
MDAVLVRLVVAAALGLLIGLEREWAGKEVAGVRTFPLIALMGALCAVLAEAHGGGLVSAGFLAVLVLLVLGALENRRPEVGPGITTETAALVVFLVGASVAYGHLMPALLVSGVVSLLLHAKPSLRGFATRLGEADLRAILRLALIGLVVWPVMPDQAYGPYGVLNPREIWTMVVLIVGISLAAYVAYRLLGPRRGTLAAGVFGGLISSTATTVAFARRARARPEHMRSAALLVAIASTLVFARVLLEIAFVAPDFLVHAAAPLLILAALVGLPAGLAFFLARHTIEAPMPQDPPSDLTRAMIFGLLYAAVLFGVAWAKDTVGERGLYVVAMISGLTDMDAITLSVARLVRGGEIEPAAGWRAVMIGAMANMVFKASIAGVLGSRLLFLRLLLLFSPALLGGVLLVVWDWHP